MPSAPTPVLRGVETRPGAPPLLRAEAADPPGWTAARRQELLAAVTEHGSLLVRGLDLRDAQEVGAVVRALGLPPVTEREAFAPRHTYGEGLYSSSAWPQNQPMCMHHELSYALEFPGLMLFACLTAPADGGATAVADAAAVLDALPDGLTRRFEREGWLLCRSYHDEIGATVAEAFGTDDPQAVEAYCRANAIEWAWQPGGGLRTRQRRGAVLRHPVTGLRCWFNQIAFLNEWTMDPEVRDYLIGEYGPDGLPFTTRHGNGDPVPEGVVAAIGDAYASATVNSRWQAGDLLLVDNIRTAHSRQAYSGPREVVVAMADPQRPGIER